MSTAPFTQPVSGQWLKPKDIPGHLLLITAVHDIAKRYDDLSAREKDVATFDYVDLDDPQQAEEFDVSDNHPGITNKLGQARRSGGMVLGRITQAPSAQGQPAWVLGPYTEGTDDQRATTWLAAHPRNSKVQQPAAAPAPAAPTAPAATGGVQITPEIAALLQQIQQTQQGA
jgi:hypothetical protein